MVRYHTKRIDDVIAVLIDYRGKTPRKVTSGVKLITAKVIKGGFIQEGDHEYIAEEHYESWMRRGLPKQWDILITTEAPLGEVAQLRTPERVALAQRVILLRGNPDVVDQGYFFQALKSPFVQEGLRARATGTTVLGVKQSELRQVEIPWWPLPTQRKIAAVLSAYDELIENNARRIRLLEQIARALYREWFAKPTESGSLPEGWKVKKLADLIEIRKGRKPERVSGLPGNGLVPYLLLDAIEERVKEYASPEGMVLVDPDDVVMVMDGARSGLVFNGLKGAIGSTLACIRSQSKDSFSPYLLALMLQDRQIEIQAKNVGAAIPHANKDYLRVMEVAVPPSRINVDLHAQCAPLFALRRNLANKNANLRRTRDLLVPKLVSGKIDVSGLDIRTEGQVDARV